MTTLSWGSSRFPLAFDIAGDRPVTVSLTSRTRYDEPPLARRRAAQAMVELVLLGSGRALASSRISRGAASEGLRYVRHESGHGPDGEWIEIVQSADGGALETVTRVEQRAAAAYRASTTVRNRGDEPIVVQALSSLCLDGVAGFVGADPLLWTARGGWCAESRWVSEPLHGRGGIVDINPVVHEHSSRCVVDRTSTSTWSSGAWLPIGGLAAGQDQKALVWQVEVNGPWHWGVNGLYDRADDIGVALFGPTDIHHSWSTALHPGEQFTSVPVAIALSDEGLDGAAAQLTGYRRAAHRHPQADAARPLIYNDYMNALMGDPTTEKLVPLIEAAASAGADYFCIDAGWYDDGGSWWPSVGAWTPSTVRFAPDGLEGVLQRIREAGMKPGLWIEPEVIGVDSPVASTLPEDAFMHRGGIRIVDHDRYFLDLRSESARAHLDEVFDRLIGRYGAEYFKWDYNVTPGTGPDDAGAHSPGDGLLGHARAHLEWFDALRQRYPGVIFEACSSGAQRMDDAILSRYDLQSTSDQQDYRRYPTIAAAAPMSVPPERAGNWAYPQAEMTDEQIAFTLVTGLSGRLYLSGHLDRLDAAQSALVREATALYRSVIAHHERAVPVWPLGLPGWDDPVVCLGMQTEDELLLFVWVRGAHDEIELALPQWKGKGASAGVVFPSALLGWRLGWDDEAGVLRVATAQEESARVIRIGAAR